MKDFLDVKSKIDQFVNILGKCNVSVQKNSLLERTLNNLIAMEPYEVQFDDGLLVLPFHEGEIRQLIFLTIFMDKIYSVRDNPQLEKLCNHLVLLNETNFAQNDISHELSDNERRKSNILCELILAIALIRIGAKILRISVPNKTEKKKNVDVIAEIDERKWGFECKTPSNDQLNPKSYIDLVGTGVEQIDSSDLDKGIVFLNLRNVIRHKNYLIEVRDHRFKIFDNVEHVRQVMQSEIERNFNPIEGEIVKYYDNDDDLTHKEKVDVIRKVLFKSSPKVSFGWFNYYSTVTLCLDNNKMCYVDLHRLNPQGFLPEEFEKERILSWQINNGLFDKDKNYRIDEL